MRQQHRTVSAKPEASAGISEKIQRSILVAHPLNKRKKIKERTSVSAKPMRLCCECHYCKGTLSMGNIGYGNDKRTRRVLPNGLNSLREYSAKELQVPRMHNRTFGLRFTTTFRNANAKESLTERINLRSLFSQQERRG